MKQFRQNFVNQIMLKTLNNPNKATNESNIIGKTFGLPATSG